MLVLVIDPGGVLGGAGVELLGGDHAAVEQQPLERRQPALVVAGVVPVLLGRRDLGDQTVPEIVPGVQLVVAQGDRHAEDAPLPGRLEDQLAVLARHGQAVAEILDASDRTSSLRRLLAGNHAPEAMHRPADLGHADHGVARDQRRQLLLGQIPRCRPGAPGAPCSAPRRCCPRRAP